MCTKVRSPGAVTAALLIEPHIKSTTEEDPFDPSMSEVAKSRDEPIDYSSLKPGDLEKAEAKLKSLRVSVLQSNLQTLQAKHEAGNGAANNLYLYAETMSDLVGIAYWCLIAQRVRGTVAYLGFRSSKIGTAKDKCSFWRAICYNGFQVVIGKANASVSFLVRFNLQEISFMKTLLSMMMLAGVLGISSGCTETYMDKKADQVRDASQNKADAVRTDHNRAADQVREASGKTITGSAQSGNAERKADQLETQGEKKADATEKAGEARADQIEKP